MTMANNRSFHPALTTLVLFSWCCIVSHVNAFESQQRPCRPLQSTTSCQCVTANDLRKSPSIQRHVKRLRKSTLDVDKLRNSLTKTIKARTRSEPSSDRDRRSPKLWGVENKPHRSTTDDPKIWSLQQQETNAEADHSIPSSLSQSPESFADDGKTSTLGFLSKKAKEWTHNEVIFYRQANGDYYPMIFNQEGLEPPLQHLEAASNEYMRRFSYLSTAEDLILQPEQIESRFQGSPFLLVANNVRDDWNAPTTFRHQQKNEAVRYMLVPGETKGVSTLFIKGVGGKEHSVFNGLMSSFVENWIQKHGSMVDYCKMNAKGKGYAPDNAFGPIVPDRCDPRRDADDRINGAPYARLVMEMEYAYRNGLEIREEGFIPMNNPYTRLFLAVMIWPKFKCTKDFCAAAVLWGKDSEDNIVVRKAVDFGTTPLDATKKLWFQVEGRNDDDNNDILPPVLEWTRPQPSLGFDSLRSELESVAAANQAEELPVTRNPDWIITLPAKDLLYKASLIDSTEEQPHVLDKDDSFTDCIVDLQLFASQIIHGGSGNL